MDTTQSRDRLTGCYVTIPTMFRDDADLSVDLDAIAPPRRVPDRRRLRHRQRGAPRGRCGRRLLDDDVRRARRGLGGGRRGRRRSRADRGRRPDDEHARAGPAGQGGGSGRRRLRPGLAAVLPRPHRGRLPRPRPRRRRRRRHRVHRLQHVLDEPRAVERADRAAGRRAQCRQPEVVDAGHRDDDVRGRRLPLLRRGSRSSTTRCATSRATSSAPASIEIHQGNYWPQFAVGLWQMLERGEYAEAQREMVRVCMPFMDLWVEIEGYTGGDGYLDKLCMELVGLPSSRNRPPTRDVRERYREQDAPDAARLRACRTSSERRRRASRRRQPSEGSLRLQHRGD